jgi:hypothetical protein
MPRHCNNGRFHYRAPNGFIDIAKLQNQLNDAKAQNRLVALMAAERKHREREAKRKNRVDFAYT